MSTEGLAFQYFMSETSSGATTTPTKGSSSSRSWHAVNTPERDAERNLFSLVFYTHSLKAPCCCRFFFWKCKIFDAVCLLQSCFCFFFLLHQTIWTAQCGSLNGVRRSMSSVSGLVEKFQAVFSFLMKSLGWLNLE